MIAGSCLLATRPPISAPAQGRSEASEGKGCGLLLLFMQPFRHYASPCPRSHALALTRTRTHIHTHILPILSLARPCDAFSSLPNTLTRSALVCISFGSSLCSSTSQPHVPDVAAPQLRSSAARHPASTLFPSSIAPPSCHLKFHR